MGIEAKGSLNHCDRLGDKELEDHEMLKYFKFKYSVYYSLDYLNLLRDTLADQLLKLESARITIALQKNALHLINILQANIRCMNKIRIDPKNQFSEAEQQKFKELQSKLDNVSLFDE